MTYLPRKQSQKKGNMNKKRESSTFAFFVVQGQPYSKVKTSALTRSLWTECVLNCGRSARHYKTTKLLGRERDRAQKRQALLDSHYFFHSSISLTFFFIIGDLASASTEKNNISNNPQSSWR